MRAAARWGLAIAAACAPLAACTVIERVVPAGILSPSPQAPQVTHGAELVAYLARIRGLNERALAAEATRQRQAVRAGAADLESLKLALALSLASATDEAEIIALVEPLARRESADDDLRAMASFLLVQATERRRLKEGAGAAAARLRDERRAHEAQKQRAEALQERAAQLQQKIDALTELEKSLSDRQAQGR